MHDFLLSLAQAAATTAPSTQPGVDPGLAGFWHSIAPIIPNDVPPASYYICVGLAVLITGISKAGFGGGVGILAIPVMALVVGAEQMLGIMLPLLIACDIFSNLHHIGFYDWPRLRPLLLGAVLGVCLGTFALWTMKGAPPAEFNRIMNALVGGICFVVVMLQAYRLTGREVPTLPPGKGSATVVGFFAGAVSTINHAAGPIVQIYLMQEKLEKRLMVGTLLLYFLLINSAKVIPYLLLGLGEGGKAIINVDTLHNSIWFIPLIPIGTLIGAWMHKRVPEKPFAAVMYVGAALSAVQLLVKSIWPTFSPFAVFFTKHA
jgi:uncharacterized membrane protein YfcA